MVYVNFDSRLSLLILESSCMFKMELQVPVITKALFFRKDHFTLMCDTLQVKEIIEIKLVTMITRIRFFFNYTFFIRKYM